MTEKFQRTYRIRGPDEDGVYHGDLFLHDIPIMKSEDVPKCPGCGRRDTVVMQIPAALARALCTACETQWNTPRIVGEGGIMHHWMGKNGTQINFNSDLSKVSLEDADDYVGAVEIDGPDLLEFVADYVRGEKITAIEQMSTRALLGLAEAE